MKNSSTTEQQGVGFGIFLLVLAGAALYFSQDIRGVSPGSSQDPGPLLFPVALSILLLIAGLVELWGFRNRNSKRKIPIRNSEFEIRNSQSSAGLLNDEGDGELPISDFRFPIGEEGDGDRSKGGEWGRIVMLMAGLMGYLVLLYFIGFGLATMLFSVVLMRLLGTSWKLSASAGLVLVLVVHLLFVRLFNVPLPEGMFGIPF